jgi:hypothetical protein
MSRNSSVRSNLPLFREMHGITSESGRKRDPQTPAELRDVCRSVTGWLTGQREVMLSATPIGRTVLRDDDLTSTILVLWHYLTGVAGQRPYPPFQEGPYAITRTLATVDRVRVWCEAAYDRPTHDAAPQFVSVEQVAAHQDVSALPPLARHPKLQAMSDGANAQDRLPELQSKAIVDAWRRFREGDRDEGLVRLADTLRDARRPDGWFAEQVFRHKREQWASSGPAADWAVSVYGHLFRRDLPSARQILSDVDQLDPSCGLNTEAVYRWLCAELPRLMLTAEITREFEQVHTPQAMWERLIGECDTAHNVLTLHGSIERTLPSDAKLLRAVKHIAREIVKAGHAQSVPPGSRRRPAHRAGCFQAAGCLEALDRRELAARFE